MAVIDSPFSSKGPKTLASWQFRVVNDIGRYHTQPMWVAVVPYTKKIVLHTPNGDCAELDTLLADELCVGDGSNPYEMLTLSHPEESLEQAVAFARSLTGEFSGEVEVVELRQGNG